ARIVAAGEARDHVVLLGVQIDDAALPFIAPLQSDNHVGLKRHAASSDRLVRGTFRPPSSTGKLLRAPIRLAAGQSILRPPLTRIAHCVKTRYPEIFRGNSCPSKGRSALSAARPGVLNRQLFL